MTLFGRTLGPQEIASLVFMLGVLALWLMTLKHEIDWRRWLRRNRSETPPAAKPDPAPGEDRARGPWG
jgi:hypothetical protein